MKRSLATAAAVATLTLAAACGSSSDDNSSGSGSSPSASASSGASGTVTVFAAASLTDSFTTLGKQFEAGREHQPGRAGRRVRVRQPQEHEAGRRRWRCQRLEDLCEQRHRDRGPAGQPG
jgi:hypothetical protein